MANIKINEQNKENKLSQWKNDPLTRTDIYFFISDEINERDIQQIAFKKGLIIEVSRVNNFLSKIVFIDILT